MAEIRCPMCSEANPEDAEVCSNCGARLKPLTVDSTDADSVFDDAAETPPPADDSGGDVPNWLSRIRERAEADQPEPEEELEGSGPDWLSRLRAAETEEPGPPEGEVPDWLADDDQADQPEEEEDWLSRLRQPDEPPIEPAADEEALEATASESEFQLEPEPEPEAPPAEFDSFDFEPVATDLPDEGERQLDEPKAAEGDSFEEIVSEPGLEADFELFDDSADDIELDWEAGAQAKAPSEAESSGPPPDWMDEFEQAAETEAAPVPADEPAGWLGEETESDSSRTFVDEPELPDQVEDAPAASEPEPTPDTGELDWEAFDWDSIAGEEAEAPGEALPESLGAPPEEESLPHVPALIVGDDDGPPIPSDTEDFDLDAIELPEWLSEAQPGSRAELQEAEDRDLAPATIPNWLEAMRPVETFQPVVELEPEEEQAIESVGPLAGLRGVLLAEPVVAKPRMATASGARLQITERQYAQADLLRRIVEDEQREHVPSRKEPLRLPIFRWLISIGLLVAAGLPGVLGAPTFEPPERVSRDLGPLLEVVNQAPADRPALVVFDYEPGYSAELEGLTGALLDNLFARGVNVVTVSTRPTGPPLALELVGTTGVPHAAENGRDYVHLGYLSGGPTAVLLFSAAPREAILQGFMLPQDLGAASGWDLPILRDVQALSDFSMVAVVAAGTENARIWAEQATPWMGDTPLVMVLSAGAEPLIRPYFESQDPQVDGILTGLPSAVAYERLNNRPGPANARWNAFGTTTLAVELVLLAGIVYGAVSWIRQLRRDEVGEE